VAECLRDWIVCGHLLRFFRTRTGSCCRRNSIFRQAGLTCCV
jgi:hypothetical protein